MKLPNMILRGMRIETDEHREQERLTEMRAAQRNKYTLMQKDEALRVALEVGPKEASRITGVPVHVIRKHGVLQRKERGEVVDPRYERFSPELKRKVVADAIRYYENTEGTLKNCFRRAAANNGLGKGAGTTMYYQHKQGVL